MRNHISCICPVSLFLLVSSVALGCASIVVPAPPSDNEMAIDEGYGLLVGTHRLDQDGKIQLSELKWSSDMKWWIEEVSHAKRSQIVRLPLDGAFTVKLPVGSYRVTKIVFDSSRGKWHTVLPTTFDIRPRECTSLGTSALQIQVGFLGGWITRQVLNEQGFVDDGRERIAGGDRCPLSVAQLESPVKRFVKLGTYEKNFDRF